MKRLFSLILCGLMMTLSLPALADDEIRVLVNGTPLTTDVAPVIESGRTLVPFRAIFEALGARVDYSDYDGIQTVTAHKGVTDLYLVIGSSTFTAGSRTLPLDVPAKIVSDRTLIPLRAVSEALGAQVSWDESTRTVTVDEEKGDYSVRSEHLSYDFKDESGRLLAEVDIAYPVIGGHSAFIENLNAEYARAAQTTLKEARDFIAECDFSWMSEDHPPLSFTQEVDVTRNAGDYLSIVEFYYTDTAGAHPNTYRFSKTFDMKNEKELSLSDILSGTDPSLEGVRRLTAALKDSSDELFSDADFFASLTENMEKSKDSLRFYLSPDGVFVYFDVYEVGPYAMGYPECLIPYSDTLLHP